MQFKKYQHIERFDNPNVKDIEIGECLIFPKIDGSNGQVYLGDDGNIKAGSRNRELTLENDNLGFFEYVLNNNNIKEYIHSHPTHRLYGEWLVPHSLKTYRNDAWKKFYIFDICIDKENGDVEYIPYDIYKPLLDAFKLDYIQPLMKIINGTYDQFIKCLEQNIFLIENGKGVGEGIVIKNYNYYNKFGKQIWAKIITSEFKEVHARTMKSPIVNNYTHEERIIDEFCTEAFIEKEFTKLLNEKGKWDNKYIPELLGRIWYEFINEECWNIIKKYKNPTINFKLLNNLMIKKIKQVKTNIF